MIAVSRARCALALALAFALVSSEARGQERERCVSAFDQGQMHRLRGELRAARADFVTCASDTCAAPLRKDCAQSLSDVEADLPTVVLGARDVEGHDVVPTAIYVDDELVATQEGRALAEDPGPHTIRFEHPPDAPLVERVVLRMGDHNREILVTFGRPDERPPAPVETPQPPALAAAPQPLPRADRPMGWVLGTGGLGLAAIGVFAYFGLAGSFEKSHLLSTCAPACSHDQVSRVRSDYLAADVSLGVGVVALGVAGYLWWLAPPKAGTFTVAPSKGGARIGWAARF
jgi:hypothetical protein